MKVLVLGGDGMLGHELYRELRDHHETRVTLRRGSAEAHVFAGVEARGSRRIEEVIAQFRPAAVVNCIGIVKQRPESEDAIASIEVNALLPHRVAAACRAGGARVIHLSTDCVFSGARGAYREEDPSSRAGTRTAVPRARTKARNACGHEVLRKARRLPSSGVGMGRRLSAPRGRCAGSPPARGGASQASITALLIGTTSTRGLLASR